MHDLKKDRINGFVVRIIIVSFIGISLVFSAKDIAFKALAAAKQPSVTIKAGDT
jgi:hypothetical protein